MRVAFGSCTPTFGVIQAMADVPVPPPTQEQSSRGGLKWFGKRKWLSIAMASVLVVTIVGLAVWVWQFSGHAATDRKRQPAKAQILDPPRYLALDPPFVVNFEAEQLVRFLQVTVEVMSRDPEILELLKANNPAVRNDLLLLFGNQKYDVLATREGKERLRAQALDSVRKVIAAAGGASQRIEAIYFTSFVMQ
jgi:flagellar protein FliL